MRHLRSIAVFIAAFLVVATAASAQSVLIERQGGTGTSTPSHFLFGNNGRIVSVTTIAESFIDSAIARVSQLSDYLTKASYFASTTPEHIIGLPNLSITESQITDLGSYITGVTWGGITGTLSSQTDLQSALDGKLSLSSWYATTTDGLDEGSSNRYYTDARVGSYISGSSTVPHIGGSATGDILRWTGSAWGTMATSGINYQWANLGGIPAGFADGVDDTGSSLSGGTAGLLAAWTDATTLTATGSPTVGYVTATSGTSTFAGRIHIASGSGAYPGLAFSDDPDTGIYRAGANSVGLSGGGGGVQWNGSAFIPNSTNRHLGSDSNAWVDLFVGSKASGNWKVATSSLNANTLLLTNAGYPSVIVGADDASPIANFEINSQSQGPYTSLGLKNDGNSGALVYDAATSIGGVSSNLIVNNITGGGTCLLIPHASGNGSACLRTYNSLSSIFNVISPYNVSGTEANLSTTIVQSDGGTNTLDVGVQDYGGTYPTGRQMYLHALSSGYNVPFPTMSFGWWQQANGNTSNATSSWGWLSASTTVSGAYGTTTVVAIGDTWTNGYSKGGGTAGIDYAVRGVADGTGATVQIVSSSTRDKALEVFSRSGSTFTSLMAVTKTGVGIGTSSPQVPMHLFSNTTAPYLRIQGASDGDNVSGLELWNLDGSKKWQCVHGATGNFSFAHYNGGWALPFVIEDDNDILVNSNSLNFNAGGTSGSNYKIAQDGDDLLTIQRSGGTDTNYSVLVIDAPAENPTEATIGIRRNYGSGNYVLSDFYNQQYGSEHQWGFRQRKSGNREWSPFVIDFYDGTTKFPQLVVSPNNQVGIGVSTTTLAASGAAFMVGSTTAPAVFNGSVGVGTSSFSAMLSVQGNSASGLTPVFSVASSTTGVDLFSVLGNRQINIRGSKGIIADPGNFNWFFGDCGNLTATGQYNTCVGRNALLVNAGGASNMAVGLGALGNNTSGSRNVGIGVNSLAFTQSGADNVAIGDSAGLGVSTNSYNRNTFIGAQAGRLTSTGSNNLFLGYQAASTTSSGSFNIAIGYGTKLPSLTGSNQLNIGNLIYGTGINGTSDTLSTGNIGIGTTSPAYKLDVYGTTSALAYIDEGVTLAAPDYVFDDPAYKHLTLDELRAYIKKNYHLPWVTPRGPGAMALSDRINEVLESVENNYLHTMELDERVSRFEQGGVPTPDTSRLWYAIFALFAIIIVQQVQFIRKK